MRGLRLQHRIVIPFAIVALVATAAASWVALSVTSDALRSRVQAQLMNAAAVIGRGDFAVNRGIVQSLSEVLGAHIITFGEDGRVLVSSINADRPELLAAASQAAAGRRRDSSASVVVPMDCGTPCLVAVRPVEGRPGLVVVLVAETSELVSATSAVARAILFAAAVGVIVMVLVSHSVVRRVTAPLGRLVRFVRELAPQDARRRAEVGDDEIGTLAQAFNDMLDRLGRSQDALIRSEKLGLAGLLAARVAHDIRNPLSSIKMQTQLLRGKMRDDPEDEATLNAVLHDVEQVEAVIRDLLELARPGELKRESADVNDVVRDALHQLAAQFAHRRIVVDTRLEERLPLVQLDRERLRGGLLNVLVNASEAMPTGGNIMVESRAEEGFIRLDVCDDGIGVDPAILERVFDPFVSSKRNGVGLGLVNARAVVEAHHGRITLVPREPRGVIVSIRLPAISHG